MKKGCLLCLSIVLCACSFGDKEENNKKTNTPKVSENTKVSFVGVGDNLIHGIIYEQADRAVGVMNDGTYDFTPMYQNVKSDIEEAGLAFINQETILGGESLGLSGYPSFNSPTQIAQDLNKTGFDIVNTASNHSLDRVQEGINNSYEVWSKQTNMITAGTYTSKEDQARIQTIKREGITFSFLAYTYGTNGIEPPYSYSVNYFNEERIRKDVAAAKKISDVVIVSAHWGDENVHTPSTYQKKYAQLFADLKVDVVIGTHPHVIEPVAWVKGESGNKTLVVYSLGNFMSGMLEVDNILSGMIRFDFIKDAKTKVIRIENVVWEPLVTHYTGDANNILESRKDFSVYRLKDYTEDLAKQHALNGYEAQSVTQALLYQKTEAIIKDFPIKK